MGQKRKKEDGVEMRKERAVLDKTRKKKEKENVRQSLRKYNSPTLKLHYIQ